MRILGAGGVFGSPANASPNGRKVSSVAITEGTVTTSGTASWWAACGASTLHARGTLAAAQVVARRTRSRWPRSISAFRPTKSVARPSSDDRHRTPHRRQHAIAQLGLAQAGSNLLYIHRRPLWRRQTRPRTSRPVMDRLGMMTVHKCHRRAQAGIDVEVRCTWLGTVMSLCAGLPPDPIILSGLP
jgi:hypothetical protein